MKCNATIAVVGKIMAYETCGIPKIFIRIRHIVFESGKVPFLSLTTLGCCRDLIYPLQPWLFSCVSILVYWETAALQKTGADTDSPGLRRRLFKINVQLCHHLTHTSLHLQLEQLGGFWEWLDPISRSFHYRLLQGFLVSSSAFLNKLFFWVKVLRDTTARQKHGADTVSQVQEKVETLEVRHRRRKVLEVKNLDCVKF